MTTRQRTLFGRALFRMFWNTYDALGTWVLLNLAALLLSLTGVGAAVAWGALLHCAARAEADYAPGWADFRTGLQRFWKRSLALGALTLGLAALTAINLLFYARVPFGLPPLAAFGLAGLFAWVGLFALLAVQVAWAFCVMQDLPLGKALKRGLLVTFAHPVSMLWLTLTALFHGTLMLGSGLGFCLMLYPPLANLLLGLAAGAVEFYDEREDRELRARLEAEGHRSWTEKRQLEEREAARVRKYQRTFREIIKPWEMRD